MTGHIILPYKTQGIKKKKVWHCKSACPSLDLTNHSLPLLHKYMRLQLLYKAIFARNTPH